MRRTLWLGGLVGVLHLFTTNHVLAQAQARAEIVVPSFSIFTAGTTISVPDRGYSSLGGVRSGSDTRAEFGPGFNRGFTSNRSTADTGVRVWIHDFQEMEQALAGGKRDELVRPPGFAARIHDYASSEKAAPEKQPQTPKEDRLAKATADAEASFKVSHAADLLKRGQEAEERGKLKVAALYYKSAVSVGATPSAMVAKQRLAALETKLASR